MSPISSVVNADLEIDHMIARVALPATTRLPDRSLGDRAPQTPEKSRRQRTAPNLIQRKRDYAEQEEFDEGRPPQKQHSLDIRA